MDILVNISHENVEEFRLPLVLNLPEWRDPLLRLTCILLKSIFQILGGQFKKSWDTVLCLPDLQQSVSLPAERKISGNEDPM